MKRNKFYHALLTGLGIWILGGIAVLLLGNLPAAPFLAYLSAFLLIPFLFVLTQWHLKSVSPPHKEKTALQFGITILAVQVPLDGHFFYSIFRWNFPALSPEMLKHLVLALLISYFWIVVIPWWVGRRSSDSIL